MIIAFSCAVSVASEIPFADAAVLYLHGRSTGWCPGAIFHEPTLADVHLVRLPFPTMFYHAEVFGDLKMGSCVDIGPLNLTWNADHRTSYRRGRHESEMVVVDRYRQKLHALQ